MVDIDKIEGIVKEEEELWKAISGIGVVIDDDLTLIGQETEIHQIIDILKKQNIPLVTYDRIPMDELKNFGGISFVILDWKMEGGLGENEKLSGINGATQVLDYKKNIDFLRRIRDNFFLPVFILTNERVEDIEQILNEKELVEENKPRFIFVKKKNSLLGQEELKKCMIEWVKSSSPIYMLELLEEKINSAKKDIFSMFYNMSPNWVNILYQQAIEDKIDPVQDIFDTIIRNIENRIIPLELDTTIQEKIKKDSASITDDDTLKQEKFNVSNGRIMIKANFIKEDKMDLGYLFYKQDKNKYYLNVTPTCDSIRKSKEKKYFFIEGHPLNDQEINAHGGLLKNNFGKTIKIVDKDGNEISLTRDFIFKNMLKNTQIKNYFLAYIIEDNLIKFEFKTLNSIKEEEVNKEFKNSFIGKILPPFITDIQLHLSQYLIRQGLPRLPIP